MPSIANPTYKRYALNANGYDNFASFYPFYLGEHSNLINRRLHLIGTSLVVLLFVYVLLSLRLVLINFAPLIGYSFAWVGHFFFEKNKPATFKHPIYSLFGDFYMWWEVITLQRPF